MSERRPTTHPRVLVIGGGFGGLAAAKGLRDVAVKVTLVDRSNHHLFQPLLYQVAMAGLSPADIAVPIRSILHTYDNALVLLGDVENIDLDRREVHLADGETLDYDYLVLSTGVKTNYFGNDDWGRWALGLKTLDDAVEIRRRVLLAYEAAERETDSEVRKRLLTFVVIGGGPTGVEIAGALSELGRFVLAHDFRTVNPESPRVILLEGTDRLLPGGFHESLAQKARTQLEELGVEVRLGAMVRNIDEQGVHLEEETIASTTILWTAGTRGRRLADKLGVELDRAGRIVVEPDCSLPGHPEAFAIGDVAAFVPEGSNQALPGVAPVAMQQGRAVARNIERAVKGKPLEPFRYLDKGIMATVGRSRAVAQSGPLKMTGLVAWFAWLVIHIWYLVGFRNRFLVLFGWAWSYLMYRRGARLITGDRQWVRMHELSEQAERLAHPTPAANEATKQTSASPPA